jgi:hypothetical protein
LSQKRRFKQLDEGIADTLVSDDVANDAASDWWLLVLSEGAMRDEAQPEADQVRKLIEEQVEMWEVCAPFFNADRYESIDDTFV